MIIKNGIGTEFNLSQLNEPSFLNDNRNYCQLISNQINHGIYDFVKNLVNKNSRVFDFGGNIGYFSYYIAPLVKSVDTFEPTPETFRVLEKTIKINSLDNVILHNKAISNKDGNIYFYIYEDNKTMNSLRELTHMTRKEINVETVSLSTMLKVYDENIDFVKIDIEGGEKFLIEDENLSKNLEKINNLFIELHEFDVHLTPQIFNSNLEYNITRFSNIFKENGFDVQRISHDGLIATK